jgi:hypothetical protein
MESLQQAFDGDSNGPGLKLHKGLPESPHRKSCRSIDNPLQRQAQVLSMQQSPQSPAQEVTMPTVWTSNDRNYTAMHTHVRRSVHLSALLIT